MLFDSHRENFLIQLCRFVFIDFFFFVCSVTHNTIFTKNFIYSSRNLAICFVSSEILLVKSEYANRKLKKNRGIEKKKNYDIKKKIKLRRKIGKCKNNIVENF